MLLGWVRVVNLQVLDVGSAEHDVFVDMIARRDFLLRTALDRNTAFGTPRSDSFKSDGGLVWVDGGEKALVTNIGFRDERDERSDVFCGGHDCGSKP